ncbi:titin homolog isoform X12 [Drosophila sechellia]|uniref:titin homolog isoform X12 n=1 Tax=Drosophila sechellia TaxID=7238 RepID=UPI0013DE6C3A|nr:titin homolog isoform X12 [Drosophila sechellia]
MRTPQCLKRWMRPYICLMELPINRPGSGNLLLGLTSVVGLIGAAYLLQCGAQQLLGKLASKKWRKEESSSEDHACNVCCADLELSSAKNYVTCCTCGKSVCRGPKCADWRPKDAKWECQLCQSSKESLAHTSSWVAEQMSFNQHKFVYPMRARSEVYIPIVGDGNDSSMQFESVSQIGQTAHMDERAKIREYVEEIVAEMLGGNLDHVKVGQLSKSENYLQLFDKFHAKLSNLLINVENSLWARALRGDLPAIVNGHTNNNNNNNHADSELADLSQTRLRSLIETIIAETLRSSSLSASGAVSEISLDTRSHVSELANGNGLKRRHRTEHYFEPKIYQDLLATAVLNKIADKEGNTRLAAESTPDLSGRHIDENFNAEALSTTSGSSIEPRSDCSLTDHEIGLDNGKSQSLQTDLERESVLSDYIAAHMVPLPDFSASVTESEDDIGSISSGMIGDGNWEDNWLFKKKRSSATPSSIGMLVPAPRENVRAQIGDKTTDEVSDLSEIGSDIEESSLDLLRCNDLNDRLLSKHLIGGQNTKMVLDELVDRTSLTSHTLPEENEPAFTETTNEFVVSPMAMPSDIKAPSPTPPPPPMIFQDDLLNEETDHTPIAAQGESEELSSLDGCTGFSTVEYIDEGQMHDTVPSVIEILAAMALGPMLAVPASEQPGAMTPSEMHTLKELSDLALAEINARTVDLVHAHSLDIIEEENTEPSEAGPQLHLDFVPQPPLEEITTTDQTDVLPPPTQLKLISEIELPPPIELVQDINSMETQYPAAIVPELEIPGQTAPVEIVPEMKTDVESVQIVPEITPPLDFVPEDQSNVESNQVVPTTESDVVHVPLHVESGPEIPVPLEIVPDPLVIADSELHSVDPPEAINVASLDLEPQKPLDCDPETVPTLEPIELNPGAESIGVDQGPVTNVVPGDPTASLSEKIPEMIADPIPVPVDNGTQLDELGTIEADTSVPMETVSVVEPQVPVEADAVTESDPVNSLQPLDNVLEIPPSPVPIDSEPLNIAADSSLPLEVAEPEESTTIEVATVDSTQFVETELPTAVESLVSVGKLKDGESVDVIIATDSIVVSQPQVEETVRPSASVDIDSENQTVALVFNVPESQAISEEVVSTIETISPPLPTEVAVPVKSIDVETSESSGATEPASVEQSEPVDIVPEIHNVPVNSSEHCESVPEANVNIPPMEIVPLENSPSMELQDELPQTLESSAVDPPAAQTVAVDPLPVTEVGPDVVLLEPPSLVETDPDTMAIENLDPMEIKPEPESSATENLTPIESLAEAESIDVKNQINSSNHEQQTISVEPQPTVPMDTIQPIEIVEEVACNTVDLIATTEAINVDHSEPGEAAPISEVLESHSSGGELPEADSHTIEPLPAEVIEMVPPISAESLAPSEAVELVSPSAIVLDIQSLLPEQLEPMENATKIEIEGMVSPAPVEIVPTTTEDLLQAESIVETACPVPTVEEVKPMEDSTAAIDKAPQIAPIEEESSQHSEKETPESVEVGLDTPNVTVVISTTLEVTPTATEAVSIPTSDGASTVTPEPPKNNCETAPLAAKEKEPNEAIETQSITADITLHDEIVSQHGNLEASEPQASIANLNDMESKEGLEVPVNVSQSKEDDIPTEPIAVDVAVPEEVAPQCAVVEVGVSEPEEGTPATNNLTSGENPPEAVSELVAEEPTLHEEIHTESGENDSQKSTDAEDLHECNMEAEEKVDPLPAAAEVAPDIITLDPPSLVEVSPDTQAMAIGNIAPLDIIPEPESMEIEQPVPVEKLESIVVESEPVAIDHPALLEPSVSAEFQDKVASAQQQVPENKSVEEDSPKVSIGEEILTMDPITPADVVSEEPIPSSEATLVEVIASEPLKTVIEPVSVSQSPTIEDTTPEEVTQSVAVDTTDTEVASADPIQIDQKEPPVQVQLVSLIETSDPQESPKDTAQVEGDSVDQATLPQDSETDSIAVEPSIPVKQSEDSLGDPPASAQNVLDVGPVEVNQSAPEEISGSDSVAVELSNPVERILDSLGNTDLGAETESAGADTEICVDPNTPAKIASLEINELEIVTSEVKEDPLVESTTIDEQPSAVLEPLVLICQAESTNLDHALTENLVPQEQSVPKSLPTNLTIQTQPTDLETQPSTEPILETETVDVEEVKPADMGDSTVDKSQETEEMVLKSESSKGEPLEATELVTPEPVVYGVPNSETESTCADSMISVNLVPQLDSVPLSEPENSEPHAFENPIPESVSSTEDLLEPAQVLLQEDPVDMENLPGVPIVPDVCALELVPSPVGVTTQSVDTNAIVPVETSPMDVESTPDLQAEALEPQESVPAAPVEVVPETEHLTEETKNETAKKVAEPAIPVEIVPEEQLLSSGNNVPVEKDTSSVPVETPSDTVSIPVSVDTVEQKESNVSEEPQFGEDILKKDDAILASVTANADLSSDTQLASIDQELKDAGTEGSIAEREVKKWYNAVEMPNNPYSPEALKQRISGTQERYMDVPNISPSAEQKALASALTENPDPPAPKADYKRYSRDYYINNAPTSPDSTGSGKAATTSAAEDVEDIVINEVNQEPEPHPPHGRISSGAQSTAADLSHWTLSTPVRRSSSLKFINSRPFHSPSPSLGYERSVPLERPSTSASHYRESSLGLGDDDDFDLRSQRSWRSSYSSLPKRHTQSSLSLHSNGSGVSFGSSVSKRRPAAGGPSAGVLTQFEKQLLHKDLKRNSFRAVSATSKDFVMNPLFESEPLGGKTALRPETEDQGDSGVDSCLNGFSGADAKYSNNSLLF